ncbi:MAG: TRAP transporter substrate-binding protein DctP [Bacteriovoracaceae bacterium]|nr:TRAP transporter substrate-binding protein DctP [Bacteriovoracaceae bacterium]
MQKNFAYLNVLIASLFLTFSNFAFCAPVEIKLAYLAPEGTHWDQDIRSMALEMEKETANAVKFKLYAGGTAGDESDALSKIKIGQLSGGMFTGKTLGDIYADSRVFEIPFTFKGDNKKALKILEKMSPYFEAEFKKSGYASLGMYEIGPVYLGSTKKVKDLASLKGLKVWAWQGDKIAEALIGSLELVSESLSLPDVLTSLSSGIINAAYAPPLGMTALQWHTKMKYIINYPVAYSIGSLIISLKTWNKISAENQKKILSISNKYIAKSNSKTQEDNQKTLDSFASMKIKMVDFPKADIEKSTELRKKVVSKLVPSFISQKAFDEFEKELKK